MALLVTAASMSFAGPSPAQAVLTCVNDPADANDVTGRGDLTQVCVDNAGLPTNLHVTWNWDEITVPGNNTLNACSLFDTDGDGNVNFALCVTDPTDGPITVNLHACGDAKPDRCTKLTPVSTFTSACSTSTQNTDPFPAGAAFPQDRVASCNVVLADVGAASATLLDICAYTSKKPKSTPAECFFG